MPCFFICGRNVSPVSISTPRYVAASTFIIHRYLYFFTGGLAAMLPLIITNFDFWLEMLIFVSLAQSARIVIVWFSIISILNVSPGIIRDHKSYVLGKSNGCYAWEEFSC